MDQIKQTPENKERDFSEMDTSPSQYKVPVSTRIGLAFIIIALSSIVALTDGHLVAVACAMLGAAALSFARIYCESRAFVLALLPALAFSVYPSLNILSLCVLAYLLICSLVLSQAVRKKQNKTQSVLYVSLALAVSVIATVALYFIINYGTDALPAFQEVYRVFFDELKKAFVLGAEEMKAMMIEQGVYSESYDYLFSEAYAEDMIRAIKNVLLASICVLTMVLAYTCVSTFSILTKHFRATVLPSQYAITVKLPTAIIYIICIVLSLFADADSIFFYASQNLLILFSPALLIIGIREYVAQMRAHKRIPFSLIFYVFAFFISPTLPIYFMIFSGISATFTRWQMSRPQPKD